VWNVAAITLLLMDVEGFFPRGGAVGDFPEIFTRGEPKLVKFGFYPSKLKKQPFVANNFKIQRGPSPPAAPPSDAHASTCFGLCDAVVNKFMSEICHVLYLDIGR